MNLSGGERSDTPHLSVLRVFPDGYYPAGVKRNNQVGPHRRPMRPGSCAIVSDRQEGGYE